MAKNVTMALSDRSFEIEKEKITKTKDLYAGWIADYIYNHCLTCNRNGYILKEVKIPKNYFYEMLLQIKGLDGDQVYDSIITETEFGELKISPF